MYIDVKILSGVYSGLTGKITSITEKYIFVLIIIGTNGTPTVLFDKENAYETLKILEDIKLEDLLKNYE